MELYDVIVAKKLSGGGGGGSLTTLTATENGSYTPPTGYDGFSSVTVAIPTYDGTVEVV